MADYVSVSLFSLSKSTLLRAIYKIHLLLWPELTTSLIVKYLPKSVATAKGYVDQEFNNLRSIKDPLYEKV